MDNVTVNIVGRENVPCWRGVTADGFIANSADPSHISKIVGVSKEGAAGENWVIPVMLTGLLYCPSWTWATGAPIYVNGLTLSQTPPLTGFQQVMGCARDSLNMVVQKGMTFLSSMSKMWNITLGCWVDVQVAGTGDGRYMEPLDRSTEMSGPFITKFRNTTTGLWASVRLLGDIGAQTFEIDTENAFPSAGDILNTTTHAWVPVTIEGIGDGRTFVLGTES